MPGDSEEIVVEVDADIVTARQAGRRLASAAGFSDTDTTMITTAISEIARNITEYAERGTVRISLINHGGRAGLEVVAEDDGPGITDIGQAMVNGYSTGQGLGLGLPGAQRLMDEFELRSTVGEGTKVIMRKWVRRG